MNSIELIEPTNIPDVDTVLQGVLGVYDLCFPNRILSVFLGGSYALGSARPDSDVDLYIIFKDSLSQSDYKRLNQLRGYCQKLTHYSLDPKPCDQITMRRTGMPMVVKETRCLFGEDVRDQMPKDPVGFKHWAMQLPLSNLFRARQNPPYLKYPLDFPKPEEPFGGYDSRRARLADGTYIKTTKMLLTNCLAISAALIGRNAGVLTYKSNLVELYRDVIGDQWLPFIEEIEEVVAGQQAYLIPEEPEARENLARQCKTLLAFENHFLDELRVYLLNELKETNRESIWAPAAALAAPLGMHPKALMELCPDDRMEVSDEGEETLVRIRDIHRAYAAAMLSQVIYPHPEVLETLKGLKDDPDPILQQVLPHVIRANEGALS